MVTIKEKSKYRPSRVEVVLAWITTVAAGLAVAWFVIRPFLGR